MTAAELAERVRTSEDTVEWNTGKSPWGPAILPPSHVARLMQITIPFKAEGTSFYGANELRFVNGPVMMGVSYQVKSKIIAVGATSKTEYLWFDTQMLERDSNQLIVEMRHMTRYMKAGSILYPEVPTGK